MCVLKCNWVININRVMVNNNLYALFTGKTKYNYNLHVINPTLKTTTCKSVEFTIAHNKYNSNLNQGL